MKYKIPFIKPVLPSANELSEYYQKILDSNWFTNFGPFEREFCDKTKDYIGQNINVTTVSSATTGLMLCLKTLLDPTMKSQKVLIPAFTFAAGPEAIMWCGYKPVFIDIDQESWQPDIKEAKKYLDKNHNDVAGILLCNIFGVGTPEIDEWERLAHNFDKPLIIDSAAGLGSTYMDGNKLGARGDCEVFSLHVTKPFGVGEGGLVSSRSENLIKKIRSLSNFGFDRDRSAKELGLNGKMEEINAAIGLWQLDRIDHRIKSQQAVLEAYKKELARKNFKFQLNSKRSTVGFVSTVAPTSKIAKKLIRTLNSMNIESNQYYNPPLHKHLAFSSCEIAETLDVTIDVCSRILSLPSHDMIDDVLIKEIVASI